MNRNIEERLKRFEELERKSHINEVMARMLIEQSFAERIEQHYIGYCDESAQFRVRNIGELYYAALKFGEIPQRTEVEFPINKELYQWYKSRADGSIRKRRFRLEGETVIDRLEEPQQKWLLEYPRYENLASILDPATLKKVRENELPFENRDFALKDEAPKPSNLNEALKTISKFTSRDNQPTIITVAGKSASGKSTFAKAVNQAISSTLISLDNYIRGRAALRRVPEFSQTENWDLPLVYDFDCIRRDLEQLKNGETIAMPQFNFKTSEPAGRVEVHPNEVIIVEGLYALMPEIAEISDLSIEVSASFPTRLKRRLLRDLERTDWTPEEIISYYVTTAEPTYESVRSQLLKADYTFETTKASPN